MTNKELLDNSELKTNYKVLKSKAITLILFPIVSLNKKLMAISIFNDGPKRTEYELSENNNGELIFTNLLTSQVNVFDITELNLGKIHFRYENGLCETFEVKDLKQSSDLQQYLV